MTTNRELNRVIDEATKILADAKAKIGITTDTNINTNGSSNNNKEKQQIIEIGRLTNIYEANLNTVNNYLPNVPAIDLERYPDYYSRKKERANREIQEYEDITAIAEANAAKAGIVNHKQYIAEYAQDCKQAYLDECKKKADLLKQVKIIIHSDGTMTAINTTTGERARYTNDFKLIE